jgi:hypothetical protein
MSEPSMQINQLCHKIEAEVVFFPVTQYSTSQNPRLALAAAKYLPKDLIANGFSVERALAFGTSVQDLIREASVRLLPSRT